MAYDMLVRGMIDGIFQSSNYIAAKKMLDATSLRHQALASNLANAETPGYKRVDLKNDFNTTFSSLLNEGKKGELKSLELGIEKTPEGPSADPTKNNVQVDKELLEVNKNAMSYQFLTQYLSGNVKRLKTAISGNIS